MHRNSFAPLESAEEPHVEPATAETPSAEVQEAADALAAVSLQGSSRPAREKLSLPLIWLDLEMTGLDLQRDTIIEIACLITDGHLEKTIEGPNIAIRQEAEVMAAMNAWCIEHHGASGLSQRCLDSTVSMMEAERQVLEFVRGHTEAGKVQLAGNSVHMDLAFLRVHMPDLAAHLHYRIVDVSSIVELSRRWYPSEYRRAPKKKGRHTALSDIRESLEELRYYRKAIFKRPRQ